jgi:peroxiredoxin (alkyl hydroperoxide reductase subunit C)
MSVLVGKHAPDFSVQAAQGDRIIEHFSLSQFKNHRYVVLFFYPMDFTFVCPTELHEFQNQYTEFSKLNAEVVGVSTDSAHSHLAWLRMPKQEGGIQGVQYPLIADFNKTVSIAYDVLAPGGMALRGTFIIDKNQIVQHQIVNNLPLGRNIDDTLRTLKALQFTEQHGEVCPANWREGAAGMLPNREGLHKHFRQS